MSNNLRLSEPLRLSEWLRLSEPPACDQALGRVALSIP